MALIYAGTTSPIERKKRDVPTDPKAARSLLVELVEAGRSGDTSNLAEPDVGKWVAGMTDDEVAQRVAEFRTVEPVDTVNGESFVLIRTPVDLDMMRALKLAQSAFWAASATPPAWIECDDPALAVLLSAAFTVDGKAPADKMPKNWMKG